MKISSLKLGLRKGRTGTFRKLAEGELIQDSDVIVHDTFYDYVADGAAGSPCSKTDCIMRLEFETK